jgi:hypothetical protein
MVWDMGYPWTIAIGRHSNSQGGGGMTGGAGQETGVMLGPGTQKAGWVLRPLVIWCWQGHGQKLDPCLIRKFHLGP